MTVGAAKVMATPAVGAADDDNSASSQPLGWLQAMDSRFSALLAGRLRNIERYVGEGLAWLHNMKQQQQPKRERRERSENSNIGIAVSVTNARGRRPRKTRKSIAGSTVDAADSTGMEAPLSTSNGANFVSVTLARSEETIVVSGTPPNAAPPMTVPDSVTTTKETNTATLPLGSVPEACEIETASLLATATKRKRGRPPKNATVVASTTAVARTPAAASRTQNDKIRTPAASTLKRIPKITPPTVTKRGKLATAINAGPLMTARTPGPDLSSIGSPMKTPAPMNYNRQPSLQEKLMGGSIATVADGGEGEGDGDDNSAKIEAWTSKFVTRTAGLSTASTSIAPASTGRKLPVVEIVPTVAMGVIRTIDSKTSTTNAIRTTTVNTPSRAPLLDVSTVEFVPPPTVTRRAPGGKAQMQSQRKQGSHDEAASLPIEYVESPLTRARRIDAQNTWREAQLKTFLTAKADMVKMALGSLRSVKKEKDGGSALVDQREQAPREQELVEPTRSQQAQGQQNNEGMSVEIESEHSSKVSISSARTHPSDLRGSTKEAPDSTLPALKIMNLDCGLECAFVAEEQPPSTTNSALGNDPIFEFTPLDSPTGSAEKRASVARSSATTTTSASSSTAEQHGLEDTSTVAPLVGASTGPATTDLVELERRRRLKERNEKAVEKKKLLLQKAQQLRSRTVANLSGKPKELLGRKTTATLISNKPTKAGTETAKNLTTSSTATSISLQKQAILNSILVQGKPTIDGGKGEESVPMTPQKPEGIFKMPLPKVKTPGSAAKSGGGEHPSSDDTFTSSAAKAASLSVKTPTTVVAPASATVSSPGLPQIVEYYRFSLDHCVLIPCSSSEEEDEPTSKGLPSKENRPLWANTPEVSRSLLQQRSIRPEDIFGEVEPVKLEGIINCKDGDLLAHIIDFFKGSGKKYTRGRTSSVWHS